MRRYRGKNEEHPEGEYVKYSDFANAVKVIKTLMNSLPPELAMSKRQLKAFNGAKGFFGGIKSK